jgi:ribosomal protein S18 acetylase RimI-like enzyme
MAIHVALAEPADAGKLAAVAARTFPLACPPAATPENIAAFIDTHLSAERFAEYLADPGRVVLAAYDDGRILGYCILIRGIPEPEGRRHQPPDDDADVQRAVTTRPSVELSKMYVLPDNHGAGVSAALMQVALVHAAAMAAKSLWLGVNQQNLRAQRFYAKYDFTINGTKTFHLGGGVENDYVMVRLL